MKREMIIEAAKVLKEQIEHIPKVGLILGSGLGVIGDEIENEVCIKYENIPHFPSSTVVGHNGQFIIGNLEGIQVIVMQGRFHFYEGYSLQQVTLPVRVMKELGVETLIVTNAAGAVNESFSPGDLMLITDHLNQMGINPLIGENDERLGVRFPDLSAAYCPQLQQIAREESEKLQLQLKEGVYMANTGPSYETPAEVHMARILGADAVGMSTVPEVIVARHAQLNVLGISCMSNMAAGILDVPLSHDDVVKTAERVKVDFLSLLRAILRRL